MPTAAELSSISHLPLPLQSVSLSVLFSVALHISGAAHKFWSVCPSFGRGSERAFVKNHCCYSNFMEIPTLFLAFSFQRTDLRLRKICLSYASLRLILQKTKKTEPKKRLEEWQKKLLLALLLSYSSGWASLPQWEWLAAVQLWAANGVKRVRKGAWAGAWAWASRRGRK